MYKYAFIYKLNEIELLKNDLNEYLIKDINETYILGRKLELKKANNIIYINKVNISEVRIDRENLIFIIFVNKIKEVKEYKFLLRYVPIDISQNKFVNNIFKLDISNNLTKISLELNENYGIDKLELMGNNLFEIDIIEEMDIFKDNSQWHIKEYTFQPIKSKYCVRIKAPNRIEFSNRINNDDFEEVIAQIIRVYERSNK